MSAWNKFLTDFHEKNNPGKSLGISMKQASKLYKQQKGGADSSIPVQPMSGSSPQPAINSTSDYKPNDTGSALVKGSTSMTGGKKSRKNRRGKKSKTSKKRRSSRRK